MFYLVKIDSGSSTVLSIPKIFSFKKDRDLEDFIHICPYKRTEGNLLITQNESYQMILKIKSHNLYGMSGTDQYRAMQNLTTFMRLYVDDMMIASLMFPVLTDRNQQFWHRMYLKALERKNRAEIEACQNQLVLLDIVEKTMDDLEFYLFLYGDSKKDILNKRKHAKRVAGQFMQLKDLSTPEVEKVICKLMNMNANFSKI